MNRRKFVSTTGVTLAGFSAIGQATSPSRPVTKVFEYTFLKSSEAKPDKLIKFLVANWFAMDRLAVQQGLMTEYNLYETKDADEEWNVLVAVGYPTERGYEAVAAEFEEIRKAHKKILIDGQDLKNLGNIVDSKKIVQRVASR